MRDRAALILFIALILILLILAQNGSLGNIFSGLTNGSAFGVTGQPLLPTVRPLSFNSPVPIQGGSVQQPTAFLPTAYALPTFEPAYAPGQQPPAVPADTTGSTTGNVPAGIVSASGQCIAPNGWVPYTVRSGETLAIIGSAYNMTVDQLAAANCLTNPDLIYEGQVIAVPPS